jgi:hypothetical protein
LPFFEGLAGQLERVLGARRHAVPRGPSPSRWPPRPRTLQAPHAGRQPVLRHLAERHQGVGQRVGRVGLGAGSSAMPVAVTVGPAVTLPAVSASSPRGFTWWLVFGKSD